MMPAIRRKALRARSQYTDDHLHALRSGHDFFGGFQNHGEALAAWRVLGKQIMDAWVPTGANGCLRLRTWAWWLERGSDGIFYDLAEARVL